VGGIDKQDLDRICTRLADLGWRLRPLTGKPIIQAFPPDGGRAISIGTSGGNWRADQNTFAAFRRHGVELDPAKAQGKRSGKYRKGLPGIAAPAPVPESVPAFAGPPEFDRLPDSVHSWTLTYHAQEQAEARGYTLEEVLATAAMPEMKLPCNGEGKMAYVRGDCRIVVNPVDQVVVTVMDMNERTGAVPPGHQRRAPAAANGEAGPSLAGSTMTMDKPPERTGDDMTAGPPAFTAPAAPAKTDEPSLLDRVNGVKPAKRAYVRRTPAAAAPVEPPVPTEAQTALKAVFAWESPAESSNLKQRQSQEQLRWLEAVLPALKARPGEWAVVFQYDKVSSAGAKAKSLRGRFCPSHPGLEVMAKAFRTVGNSRTGHSKVYARWNPRKAAGK
jgi:hypothetical protein